MRDFESSVEGLSAALAHQKVSKTGRWISPLVCVACLGVAALLAWLT